MGRRGPKPVNTHLKILKGEPESRLNRDEPTPAEFDAIEAPPDISEGALEVWNSLADDLIDKKMLTIWDVYTFLVFCEAVATYRECKALMGDKYTALGAAGGVIKSPYWQIMRDCSTIMAQYSSRFGFTPGDRANLKADQGEEGPKNGAERLLS